MGGGGAHSGPVLPDTLRMRRRIGAEASEEAAVAGVCVCVCVYRQAYVCVCVYRQAALRGVCGGHSCRYTFTLAQKAHTKVTPLEKRKDQNMRFV